MARIRSIHPGFFSDERLVTTSMAARVLFLGLGVEADDKGIFEWKPLTLKMRVLPADNLDVEALLSELEGADAIRKYEIAGRHYGAIRNFRKFQRPKTPNDIHPITDEIGNYVALTKPISEMETSEPAQFPQKVETLPPKGEKSIQMEEGGDKRKEEGGKESREAVGATPKDELQILEIKLREAAGWEREPHPNLFVVGPIAELIATGASLDLDVLPVIRSKAPSVTSRTGWRYFVAPIQDAVKARLGAKALVPTDAIALEVRRKAALEKLQAHNTQVDLERQRAAHG